MDIIREICLFYPSSQLQLTHTVKCAIEYFVVNKYVFRNYVN